MMRHNVTMWTVCNGGPRVPGLPVDAVDVFEVTWPVFHQSVEASDPKVFEKTEAAIHDVATLCRAIAGCKSPIIPAAFWIHWRHEVYHQAPNVVEILASSVYGHIPFPYRLHPEFAAAVLTPECKIPLTVVHVESIPWTQTNLLMGQPIFAKSN